MNKLIAISLLAAALLLDSPEAAAHAEVHDRYVSTVHYGAEHRRAHVMPRWLKRNKSFRRWYSHSRLRWDRRLGWHQLFRIYRWERAYPNRYRLDHHDTDRRYYGGIREFDRSHARRHRH